MKKLISISVALALLVTFMAPVAVGAEINWGDYEPGAYSKTPFGILGSLFVLLGEEIVPNALDALGMGDFAWAGGVLSSVGGWVSEPLAWMTDMTGWSMVAVGDVISVVEPLLSGFGLPIDILPIADVFYVLGARMIDPFGILVVADADVNLPQPGIGLPDSYPRS